MSKRNTQTQNVSHKAKTDVCKTCSAVLRGNDFFVMQIALLCEIYENTYGKIRFIVKFPGQKSISIYSLKMIQKLFLNQNNVQTIHFCDLKKKTYIYILKPGKLYHSSVKSRSHFEIPSPPLTNCSIPDCWDPKELLLILRKVKVVGTQSCTSLGLFDRRLPGSSEYEIFQC